MYTGTTDLYKFTICYCLATIEYNKCKWWQFITKQRFKESIDHYYPLMMNELKLLTNN